MNEKNTLTASLFTLGCRVNQYESRALSERLTALGFAVTADEEGCDLCLVNTCAVTAESDRKSRQIIRRCITRNPSAVVAAIGCSTQLNANSLAEIAGLDVIGGTTNRLSALEFAANLAKNRQKSPKAVILDETFIREDTPFDCSLAITGFDRVRAYVKIQDGCDSRCAYCIIPKVRGHVRCRPAEDILAEIRILAAGGCREVVLTGIETSAYREGLPALIAQVSEIEGIDQIRLGSMDPGAIGPAFADAVSALPKFMPHLHVSLQSGCSRTLAAMRRKYNADRLAQHLDHLRQVIPHIQFTADVICGFPGETDEDFAETLDFCRKNRFYHLHIFPYSIRPGTEAAEMPGQLPESVKSRRVEALSTQQKAIKTEIQQSLVDSGRTFSVLFETESRGISRGHSREFVDFTVKGSGLQGQIRTVRPLSCDGETVFAELVD